MSFLYLVIIRVMNLSCWVIKVKIFLEINVDNKTYKVQKKILFGQQNS